MKEIIKIVDIKPGDILLGMRYDERDLTHESCKNLMVVFNPWSTGSVIYLCIGSLCTETSLDTDKIKTQHHLSVLVTVAGNVERIETETRDVKLSGTLGPCDLYCEVLRMINDKENRKD